MIEVGVIIALILLNGLLALAELAVVSSRRERLVGLVEAGDRGAATALKLAEQPGRFLSTIQIGITLVGIVAGAFGGVTLAAGLAPVLATVAAVRDYADELAIGIVVTVITYLSLVIGELVPKRLALRNPERIAARIARPMNLLSRVASPVVTLLELSTAAVLRLFRGAAIAERTVSEEEIRTLIAEGTREGVFARAEKEMIDRVLRLGDRTIQAIMTPRLDVVWLELEATTDDILRVLRRNGFSRYPVGRGGIDEVIGVVQAKDILDRALSGLPIRLADIVRTPPVLPERVDALRALETIKAAPIHMAFIVDEYGSFEGLVTAGDLLEAVVGEMVEPERPEASIVRRDDGSWLVDGAVPADEIKVLLGVRTLPHEGEYHTVAGFVLTTLGRLPTVGEHFEWDAWRFEVVDMDGRRVDRVLVAAREPGGGKSRP